MKKKKSERIKEEKRKKLGCFIFVAVEFLVLVFMLCRREYEDYRLENYGKLKTSISVEVQIVLDLDINIAIMEIYYMTGILTICLVKELRLVIRLI